MRILALTVMVALAVLAAGCGNNRMRSTWDDARDAINKPFK